MLLVHKKIRVPGVTLALCVLALSGCEVGSATKGKSPYRAPAAKNSDVSPGATTVEVATNFTVNVVVKDKSGYGIPNVIPTVTASQAGTGSSGVTSSGCSRTDGKGNTFCTLRANLPGTYTVSLLTPVAISGAATVTVEQIARSLTFTTQPSSTAVSSVALATQPQVTVKDKAGNVVPLAGTVALALTSATSTSGGTAVLAGTLTDAADAAGLADFTGAGLAVNLIGSYTLTATLGTLSAVSSSFSITAAAASGLSFSISPSSSSATNVAFSLQPVVIQVDAQGNAVTSDSSCQVTLSLQSGDAGDQLLGSTLSMTMAAGVANYTGQNLRVQRVGTTNAPITTYQLLATPSGTCSTLATALSSQFTITLAGLPNQLRLIQPPGTAALNESWLNQPIIGVLDVNGSLVAGDNTTSIVMTKDATSPGGTLVGATTVQVVNGVATYSALKVTGTASGQAGTYLYDFAGINPGLTITGLNNVSQVVSSNGLTPSALKFRIQPQSVAVREEMSVIEVKTVDASGFFCFNDRSSLVMLSYDPPTATESTDRMQQPVGFPLYDGVTHTDPDITGAQTVVNGIATFSGIAFVQSGAKQISAIDGGNATALTSVNSDIFAINSHSNSADHLSFSCTSCRQPADTGATLTGAPWTTQPKVGVVDQFGNLMTNDNTTIVTLTCVQSVPCTLLGTTSKRVTGGIADFTGMGLRMGSATTGILVEANGSPALPVNPAQSDEVTEN